MKALIITFVVSILMWIFPARWAAEFFWPDLMAQYGAVVPWVMFLGYVVGFVSLLISAILSSSSK